MGRYINILSILLFSIVSVGGFAQDYSIRLLPFNTDQYDEFSPVYYRGDVVFCSNRKSSIFLDYRDEKRNLPCSDIYLVEEKWKQWGKPRIFAKEFKTKFNEGPATFSSRGSEIYFTQNIDTKKKIGNSISQDNKLGIYYSKYSRRNKVWSTPTPFVHNNPDFNLAHPSLSEDGNSLYLVSDMEGGFGGTDIYVCKKENEAWGAPQNLGPIINTSGNEFFPFMHSSGRLYFSSDEHDGMGRLDVFYSEIVNGEWHSPIHMDPPINSRYNDFGLVMDGFKKKGLFCSDRQKTSDDIYAFTPLYPMFENLERQVEIDYCYVLYEEGAENPDSTMFDYEWNFGDGKSARGIEVEHCYDGSGDFTVELNVIDKITGEVYYTQATYPLRIQSEPRVYINAPDTVVVGEEVMFDGHRTNITDFKIYNYYWDFGDGRKTRGIAARHIYTSRGNFIVQLGVVSKKDRDGNAEKRGVYKNIVVVGDAKSRGRRQ